MCHFRESFKATNPAATPFSSNQSRFEIFQRVNGEHLSLALLSLLLRNRDLRSVMSHMKSHVIPLSHIQAYASNSSLFITASSLVEFFQSMGFHKSVNYFSDKLKFLFFYYCFIKHLQYETIQNNKILLYCTANLPPLHWLSDLHPSPHNCCYVALCKEWHAASVTLYLEWGSQDVRAAGLGM